jgi:N,N'-diacetyllegionaminate synthase
MMQVQIENRLIGPGCPTFVIAEIGVNHDGSAQKAIDLARAAASCGADAVKVQVFRAGMLMHASSTFASYQKLHGGAETPADMLRKYELSFEDIRKIVNAVRELKLVPIATPFSPGDMEAITGLRLPAVKVASPDIVNRPLLTRIAAYGQPMLLSTGAASMEEIETSVGWLTDLEATFSLLHCVSAYPTPADQANLCWISELAARFDVPIGYSDHTTEVSSGAFAAAAGATIIEKHLTFDRSAKGPDHAASADLQQFERYVKQIREADRMRGVPGKRVLDIEQDVRKVSRQSLVVKRAIQPGAILKEDDLTVQRPGTGISAANIADVVGKRAACVLQAGTMLHPDMLSDAA